MEQDLLTLPGLKDTPMLFVYWKAVGSKRTPVACCMSTNTIAYEVLCVVIQLCIGCACIIIVWLEEKLLCN